MAPHEHVQTRGAHRRSRSVVLRKQGQAATQIPKLLSHDAKTPPTPPPTDPKTISYTWQLVMSNKGSGVSNIPKLVGRRGRRKVDTQIQPGDSVSVLTSITAPTSTASGVAKATDRDFRTTVLAPRGIIIIYNYDYILPERHFGTQLPALDYGSMAGAYQRLQGCDASKVWLNAGDVFLNEVKQEYFYMMFHSLPEAEFANYAKTTLLRCDKRSIDRDEGRYWRAECTVDQAAPASESETWWQAPPILPTHESNPSNKRFRFDLRPDRAYWLSTMAFNSNYIARFTKYVFLTRKRSITCPYLTIEFKRDSDNGMEFRARNQVAAAGSLALYNRSRLKVERLKATDRDWTSKHTAAMRHYGMTMAGETYSVWCLQLNDPTAIVHTKPTTPPFPLLQAQPAQPDGHTISLRTSSPFEPRHHPFSPHRWTWPGCTTLEVSQGSFTVLAEVRTCILWLNEIHRWGLTVHGPACEKDVKFCLERNLKGGRASLEEQPGVDSDEDLEPPADAG